MIFLKTFIFTMILIFAYDIITETYERHGFGASMFVTVTVALLVTILGLVMWF